MVTHFHRASLSPFQSFLFAMCKSMPPFFSASLEKVFLWPACPFPMSLIIVCSMILTPGWFSEHPSHIITESYCCVSFLVYLINKGTIRHYQLEQTLWSSYGDVCQAISMHLDQVIPFQKETLEGTITIAYCGCWNLNSDLLQEPCTLLTLEASLQPQCFKV